VDDWRPTLEELERRRAIARAMGGPERVLRLITERGKLLINSEGRLLWLTFPSAIRKEEEEFERAEELLTEDYLQPEEPLR